MISFEDLLTENKVNKNILVRGKDAHSNKHAFFFIDNKSIFNEILNDEDMFGEENDYFASKLVMNPTKGPLPKNIKAIKTLPSGTVKSWWRKMMNDAGDMSTYDMHDLFFDVFGKYITWE